MKADDRERYTRELMKALDRVEELNQERKAQQANLRAAMEELKGQIDHWRALLAGRKGEQLELPEAEPTKGGKR